jgi:hypothetical protein
MLDKKRVSPVKQGVGRRQKPTKGFNTKNRKKPV